MVLRLNVLGVEDSSTFSKLISDPIFGLYQLTPTAIEFGEILDAVAMLPGKYSG